MSDETVPNPEAVKSQAQNQPTAQGEQAVDAQRSGIRFGEFLAALDALSPEKLAATLKASKQLGIPLGRTLVVRRLLSNEDLGRLLEFHGLYRRGLCEFDQIRDAFYLCKKKGLNVKEALNELGCPTDEIESVRLGELLLAAQIIDVQQLNNALSLQDLCGLPLGRVLVIHSGISADIVDAALNHQTNIRQKSISYADAVDQLKIMPLYMPPTSMQPNIELDLQDLLIAGKVCSDKDMQLAVNFAVANNLPLEQILKGFDWIDPTLFSATIGLKRLIDCGYISAHEAVTFLLNTDISKKSAPQGQQAQLNLHKFLLACGFLTPESIKEITGIISARPADFGQLIGAEIDKDTPEDDLVKHLLNTFADNAKLSEVLVNMFGSDELVILHARNLVDLLAIGGATLEQAVLSFAAIRRDVAKFEKTT